MADWEGLGATTSHVAAGQRLRTRGWVLCGAGDWAIALCSPDGSFAARISPFDPTGPLTAELYRRAASTGRVPRLAHHAPLEGGGDLLVMERLQPAPPEDAVAFLADIAAGDPSLRELGTILHQVHADGAAVSRGAARST